MIDMNLLWAERDKLEPCEGLPFELFEWISTVVPIPNVDLLVFNNQNEILLSWRDDEYYGKGWHLPGGCIRFKESIEDRIQKTAIAELGTRVETSGVPIATREMIMGKDDLMPIKRSHHIAMLFECRVPDDYNIDNRDLSETDAGYLKWFKVVPDNMLEVHNIYNDMFIKYDLYDK